MADRVERLRRDVDIERREQRNFREQFEPIMRAVLSKYSRGITGGRAEQNVFRQEGDCWTIIYQGESLPLSTRTRREDTA